VQWIGFMMIGTGAYLVDCAIVNRPPIGFIKQVIQNPKDLVGQFQSSRGTWGKTLTPLDTSVGESATNVGTAIVQVGSGATFHPDYPNGKMPDSALVTIPWATAFRVYAGALPALVALNAAYKAKFGTNLKINSAYRTLAQQAIAVSEVGNLAGKPGTSYHGWGVALDFGGIGSFNSKQYLWLKENAGKYGFVNPPYNVKTGEYWHWQFTGQQSYTGQGGGM